MPEFDLPKWRIRAGVPVIALRLLNPDVDTTMLDHPESVDEIEVDIESDHSIPFVHDNDQTPDDLQPPGDDPPTDDNHSTSHNSGSDDDQPTGNEPPKADNQLADDNQPTDDNQPADDDQPADDQPADDNQLTRDHISVSSGEIDPDLQFASDYSSIEEDVPERRLPIEGEPRESDENVFGKSIAKFISSPFGLWDKETGSMESGWVGQRPLGKGGYGMAGLWQKTLEDGTVKVSTANHGWIKLETETRQHVVIKQTRNMWWKGERWNPAVPDEALALKTIGELQKPTGCVDYIDYQRYPAREVHRIYMEYAPYGDLLRLMTKYRAKKYVVDKV